MSKVYSLRHAESVDVERVSMQLRADDYRELKAMYGIDADHHIVLRNCWRVSRDTTYIGEVDGAPVCIFGLRTPTLLSGVAVPWLAGTDLVVDNSRTFLRISREIVRQWAADFSVLRNYVYEENTVAIRWLRWLGFVIYSPRPFGAQGFMFHKFEMRTS